MLLTAHPINKQQTSSISKNYLLNQTGIPAISLQDTQSYNPQRTSIEDPIRHSLKVAKQKLQATDGPCLLKTVSYLRIVCSVIQKADQQGQYPKSNQPKTTYSNLMKSLFAYDSEWWKQCTVTATGELESDNPAIDELLRPIRQFCNV